jgi:hypothetical protein
VRGCVDAWVHGCVDGLVACVDARLVAVLELGGREGSEETREDEVEAGWFTGAGLLPTAASGLKETREYCRAGACV